MDEREVARQIEQMVRFIKQEAEEKANEIRVSAEEEFNLEKLQLLEQEKTKIRRDYERREAQVEVKKKIEYSKSLNDSRLKVLAAREEAIQLVVHEVKDRIRHFSNNSGPYKKLLQDLIVQAMRKLREKTAVVRCRQVDLPVVQGLLEPARKAYQSAFNEEAPTLTLDQKDFLPPPPSGKGDDDHNSCCGGVELSSADGKIVCSNTLDARVAIAYQANLPTIRHQLLGSTAA